MKKSTSYRAQAESPAPTTGRRQKTLSISRKITLLSFSMVVLTVVILTAIVVVQKTRLAPVLGDYLDRQAFENADKIVQLVRDTCASVQAQGRQDLDHSMKVLHELVAARGESSLSTDKALWQVENKETGQNTKIELPRLRIGQEVFEPASAVTGAMPIVDEAKRITNCDITVFLRMNDAGDMLRVATTLTNPDGTRAIGTYVPAVNADGTASAMNAALVAGQTFYRRTNAAGNWYEAAYEPLWNPPHTRVIGMIWVGRNITSSTLAVRESMLKVRLGENGYVFAFGTKGALRGRYIVSKDAKQDDADLWESKDAEGRFVVQDIIKKGLEAKAGQSAHLRYLWLDAGAARPREKFVAVTYFEPWDWVIGASAYYDEYRQSQAEALGTLTTLLWWTVGVAVVIAILSFIVSHRMAVGLTKPLVDLTATARRIANGDNSARVEVVADDEIGHLGDAFNAMLDARIKAKEDTDDYKKLQEGIQVLLQVTADASDGDLTVRAPVTDGALGNVSDAVNLMLENVGNLIHSVQDSAKAVSVAALEIQAAAEQLAGGANTQSQEIVNTSSAVQEMAANTESVSANANAANEAAGRAKRAAEEGAKAVQDVITGMEAIRQNVQAGAKKVKRLGERSMEISTIVNTINQISLQTDMLALNAAIEAARAGEHGRGFTVVAEEVRKLAERAAAATQEIEKLVASIQAETNESVTAMEQQTAQVESGSKIVASAGISLDHISKASTQSAELINEISLAAKQQVRGANGVVAAMQTVSVIAQQAQNSAGQTKRSTESLTKLAGELTGRAAKFKV
ncbi:MAG: Cache 3/Cache 2 fusion domain-containing protein [Opitutaceae bacterium]